MKKNLRPDFYSRTQKRFGVGALFVPFHNAEAIGKPL